MLVLGVKRFKEASTSQRIGKPETTNINSKTKLNRAQKIIEFQSTITYTDTPQCSPKNQIQHANKHWIN